MKSLKTTIILLCITFYASTTFGKHQEPSKPTFETLEQVEPVDPAIDNTDQEETPAPSNPALTEDLEYINPFVALFLERQQPE